MIYNGYFGFHHPPFRRDLPSQELFQAPRLDELHTRLLYVVETRAMGLVTGEPGCGKSTALRRLRDDLHPDQVRTLYLHDTVVNPSDFCRQIALGLGLEPPHTRALSLRAIQHEVVRLVSERKLTVLLLIDEAHHLRPDVLALLPLLTNFDLDSAARLALLLVGQTGLRRKLRLAHLESLAQRITVRFALTGLDRESTQLYLEHRLRQAGVDRPLFVEAAVEALHNASQGIMRRIDTLGHHALAVAATQKARLIEPDHVLKAAEELR